MVKKVKYKVILASKSPRRSELLKQIGIDFEVLVSNKEEVIESDEPYEVVCSLSRQKALEVRDLYAQRAGSEGYIVIGADTIVAVDGKILGKPKDESDALDMLRSLSGRSHIVCTGVTLVINNGEREEIDTFAEVTKVFMYQADKEELLDYISTKEPMDKAGSYGIQGIGGKFIEKIEGDYNNVVGLPISKIYQKIKHLI